MNHIGILNRFQYNSFIYALYYYLGSAILSILKYFVLTDDKLILFVSFGGRRYDDSPKAIYDTMIQDSRFGNYDLVWAFIDPDKYELPCGRKIRIDSIKYFITALKARVWITNSAIERGLSFKGRNTLYFNSWHGTAIKKMGNDLAKENESFKTKSKNRCDVHLAQGQYDVDVFSRVFGVDVNKFRIIGLPRNDSLAHLHNAESINGIKKRLGISSDKKVILYAPTFREFSRDKGDNCTLMPPIDINLWQERLGDEYVLLFRAHYEVVKILDIKENDFVKNVSSYPSLNELMIVSDLLVSDYSSIFFDYSIQEKPMLTFCYDYEDYASKRGMYFDIRKALEDDNPDEIRLIDDIKSLNYDEKVTITRKFRHKYVTAFGNASVESVKIINDFLSNYD